MHDDDFNDERVKVTGVFKDLPVNTHLKFDVLFSYSTLSARYNGNSYQWFFKRSIAVTIALVTVSFQAIKAGLANPVNSLRSE